MKKTLIFIILIILIIYIYINYTMYKTSEQYCKYVSSYGIMKKCNIYSMKPISSTKELTNYDFSKLFNNCSIYVCSSAIPHFIHMMNNINCSFILVSGDCDESVPSNIFSSHNDFINFIESPKILHWYSQNYVITHPKISQIPIGLDYHTISSNFIHSWSIYMSSLNQEKLLDKIKNNSEPFWNRKIKCYANFQFSMNSNDRYDAFNSIIKDLVYYEKKKKNRKATWKEQITYSFVISPHGNGLDCHRTWEALCLGCIPIVKKSMLDPLFNELPVLIVNNWNEISYDMLYNTIYTFKNMKFNYDKLLLKYWTDKFNKK